jgi:hypothetical protein
MKPALTRCGKARVRFDQRPLALDRRGIDVGHHLHGVRIAHRRRR